MIDLRTYDAIVGVSPMIECGEAKDQDRAVWFSKSQTAGLSDGLSSSSESRIAAEIVTEFSPALYVGSPESNFRAVNDLLIAKREEKMARGINVSSHLPEHMKEMLLDTAQQKLAESYQTTFVSVKLEAGSDTVKMKGFRCGDSQLLVFSSSGKFLTSSPQISQDSKSKHKKGIMFRPGDEILARVECNLNEYSDILDNIEIEKEYRKNWLVCSPVDQCRKASSESGELIRIGPGDKIIVPKYLAGGAMRVGKNGYVSIPFSRTVKLIPSKRSFRTSSKFHSGSTTEALPDHFYTGQWVYIEDEFPIDTHFVIASDGFTECFGSPVEIWQWLNRYKSYLADTRKKMLLLKRLHLIRRKRIGDDDISFVWMFPKNCEVCDGQA